jgi:hypothetical protein
VCVCVCVCAHVGGSHGEIPLPIQAELCPLSFSCHNQQFLSIWPRTQQLVRGFCGLPLIKASRRQMLRQAKEESMLMGAQREGEGGARMGGRDHKSRYKLGHMPTPRNYILHMSQSPGQGNRPSQLRETGKESQLKPCGEGAQKGRERHKAPLPESFLAQARKAWGGGSSTLHLRPWIYLYFPSFNSTPTTWP